MRIACSIALVLTLEGCSVFQSPPKPVVLVGEQIACVIANAILSDSGIRAICPTMTDEQWKQAKPYVDEERKSLLRQRATHKLERAEGCK